MSFPAFTILKQNFVKNLCAVSIEFRFLMYYDKCRKMAVPADTACTQPREERTTWGKSLGTGKTVCC